jgi:hypothetical protein
VKKEKGKKGKKNKKSGILAWEGQIIIQGGSPSNQDVPYDATTIGDSRHGTQVLK